MHGPINIRFTVVNLRSDVHCSSVHSLRLSVAVLNKSAKYDFLLMYREVRSKTVFVIKL